MNKSLLPYFIMETIGMKRNRIRNCSTIRETKKEIARLKKENPDRTYCVWNIVSAKHPAFPTAEINL